MRILTQCAAAFNDAATRFHYQEKQEGLPMRTLVPLLICLGVIVGGCTRVEHDHRETAGTRRSRDGDTIYVDLFSYNPGYRPAGVGNPVQAAAELADQWQKLHPGKRIVYQTLAMLTDAKSKGEGEDLKTQLLGGIAPEITMLNAEVAWPDVDKGWFVPLDEYLERPNPYVPGNTRWFDLFVNQAMVNAKRAPDGKLYCVPLDMIETGVYYNKELFAEYGIERPPETWVEMEAVFGKLRDAGITPLVVPGRLGADWGQDIIFEMLYHEILPSLDLIPASASAADYLGCYLEPSEAGFLFTKGFFTRRDPRWVEMNRLLKRWRGYWARELKNTDFWRQFVTRRAAAMWVDSQFTRRMKYDPSVGFEWGVFYIPTITRETSRFASGTPASVIGGAAMQYHITNSAVLNGSVEECVDYLMYITAPANAERLIDEAAIYTPNIKGVKVSEGLAPFAEILKRPYCAIKWMESLDGKQKQSWRRTQDYWLQDGMNLDDYLAELERIFAAWVEDHKADKGWEFEAYERIWRQREAELTRELDPPR